MRRSDDQSVPTAAGIGPVLSSLLSVATIADLAPLTYGDGTGIYVRSVRDYWVYRAGSTATVDAITVVAHSSGAGRWERLNIPHPSWSLQTVWEINSGNTGALAEADGLTTGTAIPWAEMLRRHCGVGCHWVQSVGTVDINVNASMPAGDPMLLDLVTVKPGLLRVNGVPTAQFTGTISAKVDLDPTTGNGVVAKATSTWNPTTERRRLVKDSTNSKFSWVAADLTGGQAVLAPWDPVNEASGASSNTTLSHTTVGATVTTYTLPNVARAAVCVRGESGATVGAAAIFQKLQIGGSDECVFTSLNSVLTIQNSELAAATRLGAGRVQTRNCLINNGTIDLLYAAYWDIVGGLCISGLSSGAKASASTTELFNHVLFYACTVVAARNQFVRARAVFFENCAAATLFDLFDGSVLKYSGSTICGTGTTGLAVRLGADSRCTGVGTAVSQWKVACNALPINFSGKTTCPAFDDVTAPALPIYTAARNLTFALIDATVATGFGGTAFDPRTGCMFGVSSV